ncbi:MAG: PEP/pyruvate-binding domain-containing protein, partial [Woeseiaceae bacterium]
LEDANLPVAVRSSANAEDLPDFSFAGQQETFLNVRGEDAVVEAVHKCWASLWTAQAISYRHQNGIGQDIVAMAVVVQTMVPSEVSGILFTANPASGERSEMIINASFGLGEAVVGGQVTPDTYIINRDDLSTKESVLGPKEQQIVYDGEQGIRMEEVSEVDRDLSSMSDAMLKELSKTALEIEALYEGLPQDIEWAFCDGKLHLLQSRPITNLPVQPIEVEWAPSPPAQFVSRRQIVENMPDPLCPLFKDLYLTRGLESPRDKSLMVGGGPMFVTVNGYGYQRFDWPNIVKDMDARKKRNEGIAPVTEEEIEAAEFQAFEKELAKQKKDARSVAVADLEPFRESLNDEDRAAFESWYAEQTDEDIDAVITMPRSENPTYIAFNRTEQNDAVLKKWYDYTQPRLVGVAEKYRAMDIKKASASELYDAIYDMGIEEGRYWSDDSSHTFGVAKSTDDHFQCFLKETLPEHNFISGQFLTGIESKAMQANADLFEIAEMVRADEDLSYTVLVVPSPFLFQALYEHEKGGEVLAALKGYLGEYGHQGYSMDFIEPTQIEDPAALFASLKGMVRDRDYHPSNQSKKTAAIRAQKHNEIKELLSGLEYWQFRFRWWLAMKYNFIREEVAFHFGYTWSLLRPMAFELGDRLVAAGTFGQKDDIFFFNAEELKEAVHTIGNGAAKSNFAELAAERRELREARKRHHPPGTLPAEVSELDAVSFKETQIKNDEDSSMMRGFPVSSGSITAKASVVLGPAEFDNMTPGSILVSPLTTPAWTQLFANAVGLVTDVGSILAHGSIVAREYGIPAVLGVGNGTQRIKHGQTITIDGDAGTVHIHDE